MSMTTDSCATACAT